MTAPKPAHHTGKLGCGDGRRSDQNSSRSDTCPVRPPPKSDTPRALVMRPKLLLVILSCGSPRLTRFVALVNDPASFRPARSVSAKRLLAPAFQLKVPGPTMNPTPELPKRPVGDGSRPGTTPTLQLNWFAPVVRPGHTKALRSSQRSAMGFESVPSAIRSGRCVPRFGALVPDGSPPLMMGVMYGPVCSVRIEDRLQPPSIASTTAFVLFMNLRPAPNGRSYTSEVIDR